MAKWGGHRKDFTLNDLLINFARQESSFLLQRNPALEPNEINFLYSQIGAYLLLSTQEHQRARAQAIFDKLSIAAKEQGENSIEAKDLIQELALEMNTTHVCPKQKPAYLVFEYFTEITMREAQSKIKDVPRRKRDNPIMEMIMGSGKSKVLLPLLGCCRAKPRHLIHGHRPRALFASVAADTKKTLSEFSNIRTLKFDRNTEFTTHSLQTISDDLES